ncbi:MAG TPA: UDP-N-acetylmuramoyl-L-alanyl-D-glutamate--2,6-diaminopimelate ligase [Solirubrobacteraceae bacterium]|nr:UDP-N-acetylmuramoyl-L-alanyl-D-glutamate--2,6-diaminopimelate ligase [Solirubrobacteraceae bacterium]
MLLADVLGVPDAPPVEIAGLAYDNRRVTDGTLFFCVPGFTRDGHDFAPDAVARGAAALVVERPLGLGVPEVVVESVRAAMAPAAARLHGDPTAKLRVAGVTGTNGKTTTTYLVRALLEAAGLQTGLLGTITSVVGGEERVSTHTTPEAIDLQATFAEMLAGGDVACAMEVSSHALELGRASAIHWDVAIFTNLTQDHLDFHPTMEDYFAAKRKLFTDGAPRVSVINVDDPYGARLLEELRASGLGGELVPYSLTDALQLRTGPAGSRFVLEDGLRVGTPMPGLFNVLNALAAVHAARALGVPDHVIEEALPRAGQVPGRFERVDEGQDFTVVVDYSHTPDSLENVLKAARELASGGRVLCVFGCGGDRDRAKRPIMGRIAAELADVPILTSDNPRTEEPEAIIREVLAGMPADAVWDVDRRAAIGRAVGEARGGDIVVIAGKGHEQGQEINGVKHPFDDVTVAAEALHARGFTGDAVRPSSPPHPDAAEATR